MRSLPLLLASVVLLAGAPASAQEPAEPTPFEEATPAGEVSVRDWARSQGSRIGLEADFLGSRRGSDFDLPGPDDIRVFVVSLTPVLQLELIPGLYLDAEVPLGRGFYSFGDIASESTSVFGNPTIGAHYAAGTDDDRIALFAGVNVSIPTIHDPGYRTSDTAIMISYSRALHDAHRTAPDAIGVRGRAGVELRLLRSLYYRGDLAPVLYIPTGSGDTGAYLGGDRYLRGPTEGGTVGFFLEQGNELEARLPLGFGGGLRLQEVFTLTAEDLVQLAIEPFLSFDPPAPCLTMRLGFLVALDEELGFGLDQGPDKIATVRVAAGYKF